MASPDIRAEKPLRVLSISTLFPNPVRPNFGIFVGLQMKAFAARAQTELVMLNPIGMPPWPLNRREPYASYAAIPAVSQFGSIHVRHPRFTTVPKFGVDSNPARIVAALLPLARQLHRENPFDVVDAQFFFPDGPAAAAVARDLGVPFSIKARGSDIHYWGERPKAREQMLASASQAGGMLVVSNALKKDMIALGMPGDRITVHYTGLDHDRFRPKDRQAARAASPLLPQAGGPLLMTVGALIPIKGQDLAIGALAQPGLEQAHLAIIGSGADEARLRALVDTSGLANRVHFLGQVPHDQIPALLASADAMVLPSEREGLANAWIEALACGTPLVIPDIGGAREVVNAPAAGRIADRSAAAIAAAIVDLMQAPPLQADTAACAARFSWERNGETLEAHYRAISANFANH